MTSEGYLKFTIIAIVWEKILHRAKKEAILKIFEPIHRNLIGVLKPYRTTVFQSRYETYYIIRN